MEANRDTLYIEELRCRTEIGFSPHEIGKKQEILISLELTTDAYAAAIGDDADNCTNYRTICKSIINYVEGNSFKLIEKLAEDIAAIVVVEHGVPWVRINLCKPGCLRFASKAGIILERRASDYPEPPVYLSIGSNIEPRQNIRKVLDILRSRCTVLHVSKAFLTSPVGKTNQDDFVNMAAKVITKCSPTEFKKELIKIEQAMGRKRDSGDVNKARTIDTDITFWGNEIFVVETENLYENDGICGKKTYHIPDGDVLRFAHVAAPLADLAPHFRYPGTNETLKSIADRLASCRFDIVDI